MRLQGGAAMVDSATFAYLQGWLVDAIRPEYVKGSLSKWASYDGKVNKGTVSKLWNLFDRAVCGGSDKRLRTAEGKLYVYNGRWYEKVDEDTFLKELVRRVLTELGVSDTYRFYGASRIACELTARIENTEGCRYVPDRRYVCFENGVFDIKEGRLKAHHMRYCTDVVLDFPYDPRAACLLWDIKLKEIIPGKDFRRAFQQFCGSLLVKRDEMKIEYICYLYGSGSNGKSVLASAVAGVFGERYYSTFTPQQLFKEGNGSMFNMKELQGKLLNVCDDLTAKDFSGGEFKRFISGEKFKASGKYERGYVMVQPPMMLVCTNFMPESADDSYGHHRRQLPIFTTRQQFCGDRRDPELTAKLGAVEARQRIFNWIYEGYRSLRAKNGNIELGDAVKAAVAQVVAESNPMRSWAMERGLTKAVVDGGWNDRRWKPLSAWYADFSRWCKENGYPNNRISRDLSAMFDSMGFVKKRRSQVAAGTWFCIGVKSHDTDEFGNYIDPIQQSLED